jgi:hypothetical protein
MSTDEITRVLKKYSKISAHPSGKEDGTLFEQFISGSLTLARLLMRMLVFCDVNGLSSTNETLKMVIVKGCSMMFHVFKLVDVGLDLDREDFWISGCLLFFHEQLAKRKLCCLNNGMSL